MSEVRAYLQDPATGAVIECDPNTGKLIEDHVFTPPNGGGYGEIVFSEPNDDGSRRATFRDAKKGLNCSLVGPDTKKVAKLGVNEEGNNGDFQRWWLVDQEAPKGKFELGTAFVRYAPPHYGATREMYRAFNVIFVK